MTHPDKEVLISTIVEEKFIHELFRFAVVYYDEPKLLSLKSGEDKDVRRFLDFIRTELQKSRQEERAKVLGMIEDLTQRYFDSLLKEDFLKLLADLKKKLENE